MKKSKVLWYILGIVLVFSIINTVLSLTTSCCKNLLVYLGDLLPVISSLIAIFCLLYTVRVFREFDFPKFAWMMIFIGICLDFVAESLYAFLEIFKIVNVKELDYSIADYFWCAAYVPILIGLFIMVLGYRKSGFPMGNKLMYTIISPMVIIFFSIVFYLLLLPIIKDTETGTLAKFFYLFYPIGDLFIVVPAILLMYITSLFGKGIISKPWKYLAIGFIFFTLADIIYSYLSWIEHYDNGNPIDIAWNLGYLFIGLAGLYQKELVESINVGGAL